MLTRSYFSIANCVSKSIHLLPLSSSEVCVSVSVNSVIIIIIFLKWGEGVVIKRPLKRIDCDIEIWEDTARNRDEWSGVVKQSVQKVEDKREAEYLILRQSRHGT